MRIRLWLILFVPTALLLAIQLGGLGGASDRRGESAGVEAGHSSTSGHVISIGAEPSQRGSVTESVESELSGNSGRSSALGSSAIQLQSLIDRYSASDVGGPLAAAAVMRWLEGQVSAEEYVDLGIAFLAECLIERSELDTYTSDFALLFQLARPADPAIVAELGAAYSIEQPFAIRRAILAGLSAVGEPPSLEMCQVSRVSVERILHLIPEDEDLMRNHGRNVYIAASMPVYGAAAAIREAHAQLPAQSGYELQGLVDQVVFGIQQGEMSKLEANFVLEEIFAQVAGPSAELLEATQSEDFVAAKGELFVQLVREAGHAVH